MMIPRQKLIIAALASALLAAFTLSAYARGGHGFSHGAGSSRGFASHGAEFAGGRRHGNDSYIKAASEDRERLLNTQIKSICRGC
jgi:hypothetical protein